jgi:hypothetical protein
MLTSNRIERTLIHFVDDLKVKRTDRIQAKLSETSK